MAHAYRTRTQVEAPADVVWQGSKARELVDTELAGLKAESELRMRGRADTPP